MLLDELHQMKSVLESLAQQYGGHHLRVFGSVARGEEKPESDIDFLIELPRGYDVLTQRLPLTQKMSDLLGRPVDLVPEHELNRHIRDQVLKDAVPL